MASRAEIDDQLVATILTAIQTVKGTTITLVQALGALELTKQLLLEEAAKPQVDPIIGKPGLVV